MSLSFYWYPKCSTCRNAKKWLDEHGISYQPIHIVENPPTRQTLAEIYANSGIELKKFFNTSGKRYKELGLKDQMKTASDDELLDLLASDGMLIKRPLLTDGNKTILGYKEEEYNNMLNL